MLVELICALIRACIEPAAFRPDYEQYSIQDLHEIVSTACVPEDFNIGILQRSQMEWLFFLFRHYCDELKNE